MMRLRGLLLLVFLLVCAVAPVATSAQDDKQKSSPDTQQAAPAGDPKDADMPANQNETQPPVVCQTAATPGPKHAGGKDDVGAIGNRKVGGLDWYSINTDIKIGKAYSQQLERSVKLVEDPVVNEYVNRIGQNLVRNSDAKIPFTFKIIDADDINAVSLPGGFVYINSGMILAADDEAELAGAMGHEIAHVALRHGTRAQTRMDLIQLLTIPVSVAGGPAGVIGPDIGHLLIPMGLLKFSREFETEADYFGLQYMYKTGYDPNALVTFFEKVRAREKKNPGTVSKAFSTHPQTPDRIYKSQREISKILPPRDRYVETTSEFSEVKARIAVLRNQRKVEPDGQDKDKPTLRKASSPTSNDESKKPEDDRPTLQKRYTGASPSVTRELLTAAKP